MTESKRGRPTSVPDLDRVIDAISAGKYDDRILDVHEALQGRREVLQDQLRQRVREVFGPDADVVVKEEMVQRQVSKASDNPFVQKASQGSFNSRSRDARSDDGVLPGPYRINPDDNNSYRMAEDFENGMVSITDLFGGHEHSIPKAEWDSWSVNTWSNAFPPEMSDASRVREGLPPSDRFEFPNQSDQVDVPIDRRGPIIGGMSASQMGN